MDRPRRSSGRLVSVLRKLSVTAISLLATFGLVELAFRVLDIRPPARGSQEGPLERKTDIEGLPYLNKPGAVVHWVNPETSFSSERTATCQINEHGFRGPSVTVRKPDGVYRIACLGDSVTLGHGVDDDETWPAVLGQGLQANSDAGGARYESMNWGVSGYDTHQEITLLEHFAIEFDPDLVLLAFYHNDVGKPDRDDEIGRPRPDPWIFRLSGRKKGSIQKMRNWSRVLDWAADRIYRSLGYKHKIREGIELYDERNSSWRRCRDALVRAKAMLEERGIAFRVVLYPLMIRSGDQLGSHAAFQVVREFLEDNDIAYFDLDPAFVDRDVSRLRNHPYDVHPNPTAHKIAGDEIVSYLAGEGLLPEAP